MKTSVIFSALALYLPATQAVNLANYNAEYGVEEEFRPWYGEWLRSVEDPASTSELNAFWNENGTWWIRGVPHTAPESWIPARLAIYPADGSTFPNTTRVDSENDTLKSYLVQGVLQLNRANGTCTSTYYRTRISILKDESTGLTNLVPRTANMMFYRGLDVRASQDPCIL